MTNSSPAPFFEPYGDYLLTKMKKSDKSNNMFTPSHAEYLYVAIDDKGELREVTYNATDMHLAAMAGMALKVAASASGSNFEKRVRRIAEIVIETEKSINE